MPYMCSRYIWLRDIGTGFLIYILSLVPVYLGILFGIDFILSDRSYSAVPSSDLLAAVSRSDGYHYETIVKHGYYYDMHQRSTVAFFPAYPILGRFVLTLTGCDARLVMFFVSNLMLSGTFAIFSAYLRFRYPQANSQTRNLMLSLFGVWPAGFFFRMPYSESTFLFFMLLVLLGIVRCWPLLILALISGVATAARPVGLAVPVTLAWYILMDSKRGPIARRLLLAAVFSIAASWGLIAYIIYQYYRFDNPLAFVQTQDNWSYVVPGQSHLGDKIESLLAAEPIWSVFTSDPIRSWKRHDASTNPFFNLFFWNPILFVTTLILVLFGAAKSWLSGPETVLSLGLLGIPYVTRAYEMSMASHARFAAVVFPAYVVLGRLLGAGPEWLRFWALVFMSIMLMTWSALFAARYPFF